MEQGLSPYNPRINIEALEASLKTFTVCSHDWEGWSKAARVVWPALAQSSSGAGSPATPGPPTLPLKLAASHSSSDTSHLAAKRALEEAVEPGSSNTRLCAGALPQVSAPID